MSFEIGQQVICIKGVWRFKGGNFNRPKFMQIYTVRAYCACADIPSILLNEIHNRDVLFARTLKRGEASFAEYFFRPLEKIEDEITAQIPQATWRLLNMPVDL